MNNPLLFDPDKVLSRLTAIYGQQDQKLSDLITDSLTMATFLFELLEGIPQHQQELLVQKMFLSDDLTSLSLKELIWKVYGYTQNP